MLDAISYYNAQTTFTTQTHQSCERNIIILYHNVSRNVADGYFDVNSLLAGRIDKWYSRKDTNIYIMLFPHNVTIEVRGSDVIELNPDERTTALFLQRALLATTGRTRRCDDVESLNSNVILVEQEDQQKHQQQRREVKIGRLRETNRNRPETINPNKPGSLSKSHRRQLRITRKAREAMVRRINRSSSGDTSPPQGFTIHHNDTLEG